MTDGIFDQIQTLAHAGVRDESDIDVTEFDRLLSLTPTQRLAELEAFLEALDGVWEGREIPPGAGVRENRLAAAYFEAARQLRQR